LENKYGAPRFQLLHRFFPVLRQLHVNIDCGGHIHATENMLNDFVGNVEPVKISCQSGLRFSGRTRPSIDVNIAMN